MKEKQSDYLRCAAQVLCAVMVVLLFGNFCRLRHIAWPCLYKEYLSGVIAIAPVFLNIYLFFPRLYLKNKNANYLFFTFLSVFLACLAEMWMVYPQIYAVAMYHSSAEAASVSVFFDGLCVLFRDIAFVCFAFLTQALRENRQHRLEMESQVLTFHNQIQAQMDENVSFDSTGFFSDNQDVKTENNAEDMIKTEQKLLRGKSFEEKEMVLLDVDNILYCQQDHNYTYMYLVDGQRYFRYGSLQEVMGLLTDANGVQISRNTFVLYRHIVRYDHEAVYLRNPHTDKENGLSISSYYRESAQSLLGQHFRKVVTENRKQRKEFSDITSDKRRKQTASVYSFIANHPGCSAVEIKKHKHLSISTIQRIVVILKRRGMVEYWGSKRSGGYYAVSS